MPDLTAVRDVAERSAERVAALIESAPAPDTRVAHLDWTVRDLAAHLAVIGEAYAGYASGSAEPVLDVSDIPGGSLARSSAAVLAADPEHDLNALADRTRRGASDFLHAVDGMPFDDPILWHSRSLSVGCVVGLAAGEYMIHGLDLARTLHRPWPLDADDSRVVLSATLPLLPMLVNPATTKGVRAAFDLRVRGGQRVSMLLDNGILTITEPAGRADCHISADPVALMLVSYGRTSQWSPVLRGQMLAWGPKPWLGLRLTKFLVSP